MKRLRVTAASVTPGDVIGLRDGRIAAVVDEKPAPDGRFLIVQVGGEDDYRQLHYRGAEPVNLFVVEEPAT